MVRLTAEIMNGEKVVYVETEEEFWHYIKLGPVRASRKIGESLGSTLSLAVVIPFPNRVQQYTSS